MAIDIGGTKTLVAALDEHGVIVERIKFLTPKLYKDFKVKLSDSVASLTTKKFVACGVGAPGKIARDKGIGLAMGNLPWVRVPLKVDIAQIAHCPVSVENDANLAALSEAMLLKDKYSTVLYVTIGTGIGTGVIVNQKIEPTFADSEGGHMLLEHGGKLQKWESFASGKAIKKRFGKQAGEITEQTAWKHIAYVLSLGLFDLVTTVQPDIVVLGGGVSRHFEHFEKFLQKELEKHETPLVPIPPVKEAQRPEDAVVYGCYDLVRNGHETTAQQT